jgi:hypothetical protein
MAKPYRSRIDKSNYRRIFNASRRKKPQQSALVKVLTGAKDVVKSMLGF